MRIERLQDPLGVDVATKSFECFRADFGNGLG
jgi:hypothetical protein